MRSTITTSDYRAAQARAMSEDELLATIREIAVTLGWRTYHTHRSDRSEPGWPDLVLVRDRRLLIRELKSMTGRVTPAQDEWLTDLAIAGVDAGVWRPIDLLCGVILTQLSEPGLIVTTCTNPAHNQPRRTP
ncbi:MAG TPA: VRR-NUC domain-containing protein [Dermatophilaceae bacterium]